MHTRQVSFKVNKIKGLANLGCDFKNTNLLMW